MIAAKRTTVPKPSDQANDRHPNIMGIHARACARQVSDKKNDTINDLEARRGHRAHRNELMV